jgi:Ca2+-binding EF-hand superfamily protein
MGNKLLTDSTCLSEDDLNFLESNTKFTREKILQWHGAFLVDCPSGKLDKAEFIKLFKQLQPADRKVEKYCDFV